MKLPSLSLYVHIPWCVRKCPYCDFNSHEHSGALPEKAYVGALLEDFAQQLGYVQDRQISSIFFGGGTPSLFSPESIGQILGKIGLMVPFHDNIEITLEANPGTIDAIRLKELKSAGINRLSIGIQSFNDAQLLGLGRIHDGHQAKFAAESAHAAGFENFNLDLMFGLPGQKTIDAINDVQTAIDLSPTHISYYQLTIEPNTYFHKFRPKLPTEESIWDIQQAGLERLCDNGFIRYEISAFSKDQYQCRHNLNYWQFGDYFGIGAGAHGKITDLKKQTILRYRNVKRPSEYIGKIFQQFQFGQISKITDDDKPLEFLMNSLRLKQGFKKSSFAARTGIHLSALEPMLSNCIDDGLLELDDESVRCSETGWLFLDQVLQKFIPSPRKAINCPDS